MNKDKGNNTFWEEHRKCFLIAAAVLLAAAVITAIVIGAKPKRKIVDHITAEYTGDTKAGVVLDDKNTGFIVTAYFKDGHSEKVTGWSIAEPQTLQDAEVSVVTITYEKASTQCEVQCTSGLIQSILPYWRRKRSRPSISNMRDSPARSPSSAPPGRSSA